MMPHMRASRVLLRIMAAAAVKFRDKLRAKCRNGARHIAAVEVGEPRYRQLLRTFIAPRKSSVPGVASRFWQRPSGRTHRPRVPRRIGAHPAPLEIPFLVNSPV